MFCVFQLSGLFDTTLTVSHPTVDYGGFQPYPSPPPRKKKQKNERRRRQIWTRPNKNSFWVNFAWTEQDFFLQCFLLGLMVFLPPFPKVQCPNLLDFQNPWEKVLKKVVSVLKTFAHKECKIAMANYFFYVYFYLFTLLKRLFAPTSRSSMSKLFIYLEFLGEK